jgi:hypothetical protein
MGAVSTRARAELRRRLRSAVLLAIAIAIAGGATLAAFAGARCTDSAVDRFVAYSHPAQGAVLGDPSAFPAIAHLPQVTAATYGARMAMAVVGRGSGLGLLNTLAFEDLHFSRPIIVHGRLPNPARVDEVVINPAAADHGNLHVGSTLRLRAFGSNQAEAMLRGTDAPPTGPTVDVRVVGVIRSPADLSVAPDTPDVTYTGNDAMLFTWSFFQRYRERIGLPGGTVLTFRVRNGASDLVSVQHEIERRYGEKDPVFLGSDDLYAAAQAGHATRLEALALLLFGILAGLVTLTLIAQAFARQVYLDSDDYPALRAMGMTRRQLVAVAVLRAATVAAIGGLAAIGIAIVISPYMPIGLARQAEIDPGISVDVPVLLLGALALAALLAGYTAFIAGRAARAAGERSDRFTKRHRTSKIAATLTGIGSPPSATVGATLAFESGRGARTNPTRTALASAALAMAVVTGALTFGVNLTRVADHPRLQGWNWDVAVGNPHSGDVSRTAIPLLARDRSIVAFSAIGSGEGISARINGHDVGLFGIDTVKGPNLVPYLEGRAPRAADEIAFGAKTMSKAHVHIGDRVEVSAGGPVRSLRITGRVLLTPSVVNNSVPLGEAVVVAGAALRSLHADAPVNEFLVRFRPGIDRAAEMRHLRSEFPGTVLTAVRPPDLENLRRVSRLPTLLAILFALIAALTIGNALVSSVRRRRREIAVLRTLGFVRRQVSAVVAWQATTIALIAILIGLPLGVIAGRSAWTLVTDRLGLPADVAVPTALLVALAGVALVVTNLLALGPSVLARRTPPATTLRAE